MAKKYIVNHGRSITLRHGSVDAGYVFTSDEIASNKPKLVIEKLLSFKAIKEVEEAKKDKPTPPEEIFKRTYKPRKSSKKSE